MQMRRWLRSAAGREQDAEPAAPPWMHPLPPGPVVFDPSLQRASELARTRASELDASSANRLVGNCASDAVGTAAVARVLDSRRLNPSAAVPEPPLRGRGHAA